MGFYILFNLSKPSGYFTSNSFHIQKFYMVFKLRLIVLYGLLPYTSLTDWFCIIEVESVYCAVRTESLHKEDRFFSLLG